MSEDLPAWARGTPRQVRDLLVEALDARELDADERAEAVADIGERLDLLIELPQAHDANRRLLKHLRHERAALLTFLTVEGVDATNWRAEQAIRPAVVNRKVWGGNRTDAGAVTQGRVMTFLRTAHQQGADAVALLVDLARAPVPAVVEGLTLRLSRKSAPPPAVIHANRSVAPRYPSTHAGSSWSWIGPAPGMSGIAWCRPGPLVTRFAVQKLRNSRGRRRQPTQGGSSSAPLIRRLVLPRQTRSRSFWDTLRCNPSASRTP